ncbi:hypothetical protein XENOCAPTIV_001886, partial [Xenoophorus captivus]
RDEGDDCGDPQQHEGAVTRGCSQPRVYRLVNIIVTTNGEPVTSKEIKSCIHLIQELIVVRLNQAVANKLISSVDYLRESFVGTLERCLNSLEKSSYESSVHNVTSNHLKQVGEKFLFLKVELILCRC